MMMTMMKRIRMLVKQVKLFREKSQFLSTVRSTLRGLKGSCYSYCHPNRIKIKSSILNLAVILNEMFNFEYCKTEIVILF